MSASDLSPLTMLRGLAWDVGAPIATHYALHLLGGSDWPALLAATGVAAARVARVAVRDRALNPFATVMLVVCGAGLALAFTTGDPRPLLLRNSFITVGVGLVFLVTAIRGRRPLTLAALQTFMPAKAAEFAREYAEQPRARHAHRFSSTVWGIGLITEATVRVVCWSSAGRGRPARPGRTRVAFVQSGRTKVALVQLVLVSDGPGRSQCAGGSLDGAAGGELRRQPRHRPNGSQARPSRCTRGPGRVQPAHASTRKPPSCRPTTAKPPSLTRGTRKPPS